MSKSESEKLTVALIVPPLSLHRARGVGAYTQNLYNFLKKIPNLNIKLTKLDESINNYDLIHYPYFDPFFLTLPYIKKTPTIVTIHDLIPLKYLKEFKPGLRGLFKWQIQKRSLQNTNAIITDSKSSKSDIIKISKIPSEKIQVIPLGVSEEFKLITSQKKLLDTKNKLRLPDNYLLYVGDVNYNKNIPNLLHTFNSLNKKISNLDYVLVGQGFVKDSPQLRDIKKLIHYLHLEQNIKIYSHLDLKDLVAVYNLAKICLLLSIDEGFGLPVIEAMSCGCPIVVSNIPSLNEVVNNAGILVDPFKIEAIVDRIQFLLQNENTRISLSEKGLQRAKYYTWDKCASETYEVYKNIIISCESN